MDLRPAGTFATVTELGTVSPAARRLRIAPTLGQESLEGNGNGNKPCTSQVSIDWVWRRKHPPLLANGDGRRSHTLYCGAAQLDH